MKQNKNAALTDCVLDEARTHDPILKRDVLYLLS